MSEERTIELQKAILSWLFDNRNLFNRLVECRKYFSAYIYDNAGNYLIGGEEVSNFIDSADKLLFGKEAI